MPPLALDWAVGYSEESDLSVIDLMVVGLRGGCEKYTNFRQGAWSLTLSIDPFLLELRPCVFVFEIDRNARFHQIFLPSAKSPKISNNPGWHFTLLACVMIK